MPAAPAKPTPLRMSGQAGIFPSPGRVSSTGIVDRAGDGPAVVGGNVPATVVGTVEGGVVGGPLVDERRTVLGTVGRVVAGAFVVGGAVGGAAVVAGVASVVGVVGIWAAARAHKNPPVRAAIAHRHTTATGRDTRRCLPLRASG